MGAFADQGVPLTEAPSEFNREGFIRDERGIRFDFHCKEKLHGAFGSDVGYLPVTCHLTCPVTDYASRSSRFARFESQRYLDFPTMVEAIKSGRLQASFMVVPLAMKLREQGVPVKLVYLGHREGSTLMVRAANPATDLAALRGTSFAIPTRYSNQNLVLHRLMAQQGLTEADLMRRATAPLDDQLADPRVVGGVQVVGHVPRFDKKDQPILPMLELSFPHQPLVGDLDPGLGKKPSVAYAGHDGMMCSATVEALDVATGRVGIVPSKKAMELGVMPAALVLNDYIGGNLPSPVAACPAITFDEVTKG